MSYFGITIVLFIILSSYEPSDYSLKCGVLGQGGGAEKWFWH